METNRFWTLSEVPVRETPVPANFNFNEAPIPQPGPGQALTRTLYISLDPYQWGYRVRGLEKPGELCHARTVAQVIESNSPAWAVGDYVHCLNGWAEYGLIGEGIPEHPYMKTRKIDPDLGPVSTALGVLGMNGLTAYAGLMVQCQPKPGETVVVSAATGGVGQIVGQIAKVQGCRAVGIAGRPEKLRVAVDELRYDACVSHLSPTLAEDLAAACPDGVDVYYENVGGALFDATSALFNQNARMTICGLIGERPEGKSALGKVAIMERSAALRAERNVTVHELSVGNFVDSHFDQFLREMSAWYRAGQITYREDIRRGIEIAPESYIDMMAGGNLGKTLVQTADAI
ncbi:NADP-dependent oxidoreductase [Pseudooceanicola sp.]|uniref:NADP-dependent oxidoreductase n=1 Tax=Pseudooceanicola sp. TaxID=1914328 RepID=UPI0026137651|nr:NADP-dependent oxidoreductase [Pseudooceanicola sp.]MDF1854398.1 NADP-dependent oxidoreductase [Pseudooceanicola sp.]